MSEQKFLLEGMLDKWPPTAEMLKDSDKKHEAVFGDFSDEDLFNDNLKPNTQVTRTTQFDILYDEEKTYRIGILPTKEQSSNDIGIICVQNC